MTWQRQYWLIVALLIILFLGAVILGSLEGQRRVERREAAAYSAFIKTTGNKHKLTFEEWRASR